MLEFTDASFDLVTATGVLEYASDQQRVLAEVARVLRTDGLAVLSIPNPRAFYAAWKRVAVYPAARALARARLRSRVARPRGAHPIDRPAFEALLAAVGLEVETLRYTSFVAVPTPLDVMLPTLTVRLARRLDGVPPRVARRLATQIVFLVRRDIVD